MRWVAFQHISMSDASDWVFLTPTVCSKSGQRRLQNERLKQIVYNTYDIAESLEYTLLYCGLGTSNHCVIYSYQCYGDSR
ncbi:hypothetical protein KIN20_001895 [Parelaphostrongylus tenuis]|uniref:Uncharacterized protein n=1 Tax=Parelaphostrongylus tenuis TaxID=148309 RepID=A0AAD5QGF6_PARTN|nr:hypothetical protein KIN20_001895 [Parelaphostrongylus tenuis]